MKSNQLFGPYGNTRYNAGSLNTAKGFIGQYNDGTGLDYFNARYYDPIVGVFLSADTVQDNVSGHISILAGGFRGARERLLSANT